MATNKIFIDVEINGKFQKVAVDANKLGDSLGHVSKNARTADRNVKGAAQASSNGTKNFAKMAQGLTGGLVPAYAAVAAQVFALTAAFNFLKNAADLQNLKASQVSYAQSTGMAMQSMTKQIQDASGQMIGFKEAAQAAAMGAAKGFTSAQLTALAEGAGKAATAMGRSYQDTFDRLLRGVSKAEPELLDELGITLRLEKATKDYAAAIGVSADSLTAAQRSQAVYLETMRQLNDNFGAVKQATNPFQQLAVTLEKVGQTVTEAVLPGFIAIAQFINNNAKVAAAAFAALVAMVLINIAGLKEGVKGMFISLGSSVVNTTTKMGSAFSSWTDKVSSGASSAVSKLEEVEKKMQAAAKAGAGGAAKKMLDQGAGSKVLAKVAAGEELTPQMRGALLKNLEKVKKELKETGETASKAFAGATVESIEAVERELKKVGKTSLTVGQRFKKGLAKVAVSGLKQIRTYANLAASSLRIMGQAARFTAKGFAMIGKATVVLAIIGKVLEAFDSLAAAPATAINSFINFVSKFARIIDLLINTVISGLNNIPGVKITAESNLEEAARSGLTSLGNSALEAMGYQGKDGKTALETQLAAEEAAAAATAAHKEEVDRLRESYAALKSDLKGILEGLSGKTGADAVKQSLQGIATLPMAAAMEAAAKDPELKKAFEESIKGMNLDTLSYQFGEAVRSGDIKEVERLTTLAGVYNGSLAEVNDTLGNLRTTMQDGDPLKARLLAQTLIKAADAGDFAAAELGKDGGLLDLIDNRLGQNIYELAEDLLLLEDRMKKVAMGRQQLALSKVESSRGPQLFQQQDNLNFAVTEKGLALEEKRVQLALLEKDVLTSRTPEEQEQFEIKKAGLRDTIALMERQKEVLEENASIAGQFGDIIGNSITNNMQSAMNSLITGAKSFKDAFADMARSVLTDIAAMLAKMLTMRILMSAFGGTGFGDFIGIPTKRYGGVVSNGKDMPGYAVGGIASGPQSGYPVMMHGTEAVVPLPNGKSIPVEMRGAGQMNNVTVNVSTDGNTRTENSSGAQAADLGKAIAKAVQQELQNQKRSGGILNPYGVA